MNKAVALLAVLALGLSACGNKPETTDAPAAGEAATTAAPAAAAPTSEPATAAAGEPVNAGDAALERMTPMPATQQLPAGRWKAGTHYKPLVPAQNTSAAPGEVEVVEVFWYGCGHCYALDPVLENWKKTKPAHVKFVRLPVMWGPVHRAHGQLFYTLEALNKLDALHAKTFDEIHQRRNMLVDQSPERSFQMQLAFAKANGISEADFTREYKGFFVNSSLQRAEDLTRRYRVEGVPMVVINGKYVSDVGMAGGGEQLVQLINDLAASEKR
jgi:protein dithiol oxidoreductase (disulfide-forming)